MSYINRKLRAFNDVDHPELRRKRSDGRMKTYPSAVDARAWCDNREERRQHILDLIKQGDGKGLSLGKYVPIDAIIDILLANKNADIKRLLQEIEELKKILQESGIHYEEKPVSVVEPVDTSSIQEPEAVKVTVPTLGDTSVRKKRSLDEDEGAVTEEPGLGVAEAALDEETGVAEAPPAEEAAIAEAAPSEEPPSAEIAADADVEAPPGEEGEESEVRSEEASAKASIEDGAVAEATPLEEEVVAELEPDATEVEEVAPGEENVAEVAVEGEAADEKRSRVSSDKEEKGSHHSSAQIVGMEGKKTSSGSVSGMQVEENKSIEEKVEEVVQYEEAVPVEEKSAVEAKEKEEVKPSPAMAGGEAFYRVLAIEAIQQLENIRNIVEEEAHGSSPPDQPEDGSRKSKESIKSGSSSHQSEKLPTIGEEPEASQPEVTGSTKSKESNKSEENGKIKSVLSAPDANQHQYNLKSKESVKFEEDGKVKSDSSVPVTSPQPNDDGLRRRLDSLRGLEDEIRKLRNNAAKSVDAGGDSSERDKLQAEIDECQLKLKELEILKIEKSCLKGRCRDLEGIQRDYEDLLKKTQGFETMKAQCSLYKNKYDEMQKLNEECIELRTKAEKADTLEKEREVLLKEIKDCECCISHQENDLKRLTCHIECLSEQLDKQKGEGKTRTMVIKARLKKEDLLPVFHETNAGESNDETVPCETDCLRSRIEELENEIEQMKNEGNAELDAQRESSKALEESVKAMESNYNALDSNYKALDANYKTLDEKYKKLEEKCSALEKEYQELETKHKASVADYKDLDAKYKAAGEEYNTLKAQYKASEASYQKLNASYQAMEIKYKALDTTFKQMQSSRKSLEDNLKCLQENNKTCLENLESEKNNSLKLSEALCKAIKNDEHLKQMLKQTKCAIKCITLKLKKHEIVGPGQLEQQRNEFCKKIQELQGFTEAPCGAEKITELEDELTRANATIKCLRDNLDQLKGVMDENDTLGKLAVQLQEKQLKPFGPALIK